MTTISEIVVIVCLARKQQRLSTRMVSVGKLAAEKVVVIFVGKLRCRWVVSPVQSGQVDIFKA